MNTSTMRWLLDIDRIPEGASDVALAWEHPWPLWFWGGLIILVALVATWSYSRLVGNRTGRGILAVSRAAILTLVIALIAGPMLELKRETVEEDWVVMLLDRSESMSIADTPGANGRISRDRQLASMLFDNADVWTRLDEQRHIVWLGFHGGAFDLPAKTDGEGADGGPGVDLGMPDGLRTNVDAAIEQALQRAVARPLSGIVVFSDGRSSISPSRSLLRRLQADAVPVFSVPLGSAEPVGDLAIGRVDSPRSAFVRDRVPIRVELERLGADLDRAGATLRLVDTATGEELDSVELDGDSDDQITLTAEPKLAGEATWQVVIETTTPDLIPENNLKPFRIELVDRPLRVLYVDGYPRWEYRFIKWLLVREQSIESSILLLSADRDFAQEGNLPITRMPRSPEEFAEFDVIILGDVPSSFFSDSQLSMLRDHVALNGAGLLWVGGERYSPNTYAASDLAALLPMRGSLQLPLVGEAVNMMPTEVAARLNVMRLSYEEDPVDGWPDALSDPSYRWSRIQWAQRIEPGRLKPTAEVLAETVNTFNGAHLPLVTHMRYGAGKTIYVATDEVWRWRYGWGERIPEQFWVQMIRMLGRESVAGGTDPAVLEVEPRRVAVRRPIRIDLRIEDAQLARRERASVRAVLEREDTGEAVAELDLKRVDDDRERYAATYLPEVTGNLRVRIKDAAFAGVDVRAPVEVYEPEDELRRPESDHGLLAALSAETGGEVLDADTLDRLLAPNVLRKRAASTINSITESIWDTPLAFALILLLLAGEWIGRKVLRLA